MNALTRDLIKLTDIAETQGAEKEEKLLFPGTFPPDAASGLAQ